MKRIRKDAPLYEKVHAYVSNLSECIMHIQAAIGYNMDGTKYEEPVDWNNIWNARIMPVLTDSDLSSLLRDADWLTEVVKKEQDRRAKMDKVAAIRAKLDPKAGTTAGERQAAHAWLKARGL